MHRQPNEQSTGESEPVLIADESSEGLVILLPDSDGFHIRLHEESLHSPVDVDPTPEA